MGPHSGCDESSPTDTAAGYVIRLIRFDDLRTMDSRASGRIVVFVNKASARIGHMDPLGTLIVTLGTLVILDIAALQLGGYRRPRSRARGSRR